MYSKLYCISFQEFIHVVHFTWLFLVIWLEKCTDLLLLIGKTDVLLVGDV